MQLLDVWARARLVRAAGAVDGQALVAAQLVEAVARLLGAADERREQLRADDLLDQVAVRRLAHVDLHEQRADDVGDILLLGSHLVRKLRRLNVQLPHEHHLEPLHVVQLRETLLRAVHRAVQVLARALVVVDGLLRLAERALRPAEVLARLLDQLLDGLLELGLQLLARHPQRVLVLLQLRLRDLARLGHLLPLLLDAAKREALVLNRLEKTI